MKHVFVINSHTTFLNSMGTVEYLHLNDDDIIFLYNRNYSNKVIPVPYKVVDATEITLECKKITHQYKEYLRKVDEFIDANIHGRYQVYVPHLGHYFFQLLYTHRRCCRVSYVQEGGPALFYVFENNVSLIERIKSFIRHAIRGYRTFECKWYKRGIIYKQIGIDSYAINDVYFKNLPSRNHIVRWPKAELNIQLEVKNPIFIFDGHIFNGLVEPAVYLQECDVMIRDNACEQNYVKFHPAQTRSERDAIIDLFAKVGCKAEEMTDDIPMECIITQFSGLTFVGFTSSLLYYAHDNGHKVVCCEESLIKASPTFAKHIKESGFQTYEGMYGEKVHKYVVSG